MHVALVNAHVATPKLPPRAVGQLKIVSGCHVWHQTVPNEQQNTRPSVGDGKCGAAARNNKISKQIKKSQKKKYLKKTSLRGLLNVKYNYEMVEERHTKNT